MIFAPRPLPLHALQNEVFSMTSRVWKPSIIKNNSTLLLYRISCCAFIAITAAIELTAGVVGKFAYNQIVTGLNKVIEKNNAETLAKYRPTQKILLGTAISISILAAGIWFFRHKATQTSIPHQDPMTSFLPTSESTDIFAFSTSALFAISSAALTSLFLGAFFCFKRKSSVNLIETGSTGSGTPQANTSSPANTNTTTEAQRKEADATEAAAAGNLANPPASSNEGATSTNSSATSATANSNTTTEAQRKEADSTETATAGNSANPPASANEGAVSTNSSATSAAARTSPAIEEDEDKENVAPMNESVVFTDNSSNEEAASTNSSATSAVVRTSPAPEEEEDKENVPPTKESRTDNSSNEAAPGANSTLSALFLQNAAAVASEEEGTTERAPAHSRSSSPNSSEVPSPTSSLSRTPSPKPITKTPFPTMENGVNGATQGSVLSTTADLPLTESSASATAASATIASTLSNMEAGAATSSASSLPQVASIPFANTAAMTDQPHTFTASISSSSANASETQGFPSSCQTIITEIAKKSLSSEPEVTTSTSALSITASSASSSANVVSVVVIPHANTEAAVSSLPPPPASPMASSASSNSSGLFSPRRYSLKHHKVLTLLPSPNRGRSHSYPGVSRQKNNTSIQPLVKPSPSGFHQRSSSFPDSLSPWTRSTIAASPQVGSIASTSTASSIHLTASSSTSASTTEVQRALVDISSPTEQPLFSATSRLPTDSPATSTAPSLASVQSVISPNAAERPLFSTTSRLPIDSPATSTVPSLSSAQSVISPNATQQPLFSTTSRLPIDSPVTSTVLSLASAQSVISPNAIQQPLFSTTSRLPTDSPATSSAILSLSDSAEDSSVPLFPTSRRAVSPVSEKS